MVGGGAASMGAGKNGGERVLSQEEIDNLLGFRCVEVNLDENSGIRAIIDRPLVNLRAACRCSKSSSTGWSG